MGGDQREGTRKGREGGGRRGEEQERVEKVNGIKWQGVTT